MKIELHEAQDVIELIAMLDPVVLLNHHPRLRQRIYEEAARQQVAAGETGLQVEAVPYEGEWGPLPSDIARPASVNPQDDEKVCTVVSEPEDTGELPDRDADGAQYDTRWHSEPKKLTDKGVFRARRGRDNDAYKAWLLEQAVEVAEAAITADEAEPVATETHALPQDDGNEVDAEPQEPGSQPSAAPATPASAVDLETLIAASLEAAKDASDSHVDLLNACRDFTSKHGHPAFTALKAAVAPDDAGGGGKAVQHFTPGERRLMQACIANYPSN